VATIGIVGYVRPKNALEKIHALREVSVKVTRQTLVDMAAVTLLGPLGGMVVEMPSLPLRFAAAVGWGICLARAFKAVLRAPPPSSPR
jgi:hypothetical protein